MIVSAKIQKVEVDPIEVIQALLDAEIGVGNKIEYIENSNKYYIVQYSTEGPYNDINHVQITRDRYLYILSLQTVKYYLDEVNKNKAAPPVAIPTERVRN